MPKKLKISSNERVDLVDFNRAATGYTEDSDKFHRSNLWLSEYSGVLRGFRIEISDQSTSPGEFTIYNGLAIDRDGSLLNNEDQIADARTHTLTGTSSSFYIEIEFTQTESDVDVRAFWDPTYTVTTPAGREFTQNVSTRYSTDWQVVTPVNTSAFDITGDPDSVKIPVAVLTTNGSNEITGFTAQNIATVLAADVSASATTIKVVDSTLFPSTGTATLGFGDSTNEAVSITANDRVNGILTLGGPLSNSYEAGAILKETGVTAYFVPENKDAAPSSDEDRRRRVFAGNEVKGSALSADPQDTDLRSDLQIAGLKDYIDFLAAQIRELKFGSQRDDTSGGIPPSSWTNTRYYDPAGGVAGARTASITIGDGADSYGDIIATSGELSAAVQAAHDALDSANGGSIYVKGGEYTWNGTVTLDRPVSLVFDHGAIFKAGTYSGLLETDNADALSIYYLPARADFRLDVITSSSNNVGANFTFVGCEVGRVEIDSATPAGTVTIVASESTFSTISATASKHTIHFPADATGRSASLRFDNCTFSYNNVSNGSSYLVYGNISNATFNDCTFDAAVTTGSCNGFVFTDVVASASPSNWKFKGCSFIDTDTAEVTRAFTIGALADLEDIVFEDCVFDFNYTASPASIYLIDLTAPNGYVDDCRIEGCDFEPMGVNAINGTSSGTRGRMISFNGLTSSSGRDRSNEVIGCKFGIPVLPGAAVGETPNDFVTSVYNEGGQLLYVRDCLFRTVGYGVRGAQDSGIITVENCTFIICPGNAVDFGQEVKAVSADRETVVVRNCLFDLGRNSSANSSPSTAIEAFHGTITDNDITCAFNGSSCKAINLYTTLALATSGYITGNKIVSGQNTNTGGLVVGIDCGGTGIAQNYDKWFISNNDILCATGTSADDIYGIRVETDADIDDGSGAQITGNKIAYSVNSASASMSNAYAIFAEIGNGNVSNNTIIAGESAQTGVTADLNGIYVIGNNVNVNDNNVNIDPFSIVLGGRCIWVDAVNDSGASFHFPGTINVCNNICTANISAPYLIQVRGQANDDDLAGVNVVGNICSTEGTSTSFLIYVSAATADSPGAYNVSNNTVIEVNQPTALQRVAIHIDAQGAVTDCRGVVCSNNVVMGNNSSYVRSSATNYAAIVIVGGLGVVCNGNAVRGWVGSGIANRKSISIDAATDVVCNSNSTEYSGSAGTENILINNCAGVNVSGNMCNTGSFATTGSTDVVSTGSNNT